MESSLLLLLLLLFWCRPSTMNERQYTGAGGNARPPQLEKERETASNGNRQVGCRITVNVPISFLFVFLFYSSCRLNFFFLEIRLFDQFFFSSFFSFFSAVGFVDRERGNNSNTLLAFYIWRRLRRCGRFCDLFSFGLAWTGVVFCDDKRDIAFDRRTRSLIATSFIIFCCFYFFIFYFSLFFAFRSKLLSRNRSILSFGQRFFV